MKHHLFALMLHGALGHHGYWHRPPDPVEYHITAPAQDPADVDEADAAWEARCGTMLYTDPAHYAHAAAVARRCGTRLR